MTRTMWICWIGLNVLGVIYWLLGHDPAPFLASAVLIPAMASK